MTIRDLKTGLTHLEEDFARALASGMPKETAFRGIYQYAESWPDSEVKAAADRLSRAGRIVNRVRVLRSPESDVQQYNELTETALLNMVQDVYIQSMSTGKVATALNAIALVMRTKGMLVEDRKNEKSPISDVAAGALRAVVEQIQNIKDKERALASVLDF